MKNKKIVKVIATSFIERQVRESSIWYEHGQNLGAPIAVLNMIKDIVEKNREIDAGLPMDTIIVNNDSGYNPGRQYLDTINGTITRNGVFKVIHRENWGRSFGAYNEAFMQYRDEYDYWIFSEDDMYFSKDGYAKEYLDILEKDEKIAFVAAIGIGRPTERTKHAHGGCGMTHKKYMEETVPINYNYVDELRELEKQSGEVIGPAAKKSGCLAHLTKNYINWSDVPPGLSNEEYTATINKNTRLHCIYGEVPFTYSLVHLGYDIIVPEDPKQWYSFYE